jgi:hypothetical protein
MLVITGTGRCGTTLLAAYCKMMGHDPGGRGGPHDEAGFEDPEVCRIHGVILRQGAPRAAPLLRGLARTVVKDPRFVTLGAADRLLPAWARCRPDLRFLILHRRYESAAASFARQPERFERSDAAAIAADLRRFFASFLTTLRRLRLPYRTVPLLRPDTGFADVEEVLVRFGGLALVPDAAVVRDFGLAPRPLTPRAVWESWFDPTRIHFPG